MKEIIFYRTESGKSPIEEFFDSLTDKQLQKVAWVLRIIRDLEYIPIEYFKKLNDTEEIWEVRIQSGNNSFRILGFFDDYRFIVLTNGFAKKTQKTPLKEIRIAESRRKEYLGRKK